MESQSEIIAEKQETVHPLVEEIKETSPRGQPDPQQNVDPVKTKM